MHQPVTTLYIIIVYIVFRFESSEETLAYDIHIMIYIYICISLACQSQVSIFFGSFLWFHARSSVCFEFGLGKTGMNEKVHSRHTAVLLAALGNTLQPYDCISLLLLLGSCNSCRIWERYSILKELTSLSYMCCRGTVLG